MHLVMSATPCFMVVYCRATVILHVYMYTGIERIRHKLHSLWRPAIVCKWITGVCTHSLVRARGCMNAGGMTSGSSGDGYGHRTGGGGTLTLTFFFILFCQYTRKELTCMSCLCRFHFTAPNFHPPHNLYPSTHHPPTHPPPPNYDFENLERGFSFFILPVNNTSCGKKKV